MVGTITSLGIGSGFDTQSIVDQLVAAEREPRELRLAREEAGLQAELSAFGVLAAALDDLGSTGRALQGLSTSRSATLSRQDAFSVDVSAEAVPGNFTVAVEALASAQTLASVEFADADTEVGGGVLSLLLGETSVDVEIAASSSVADIAAAINDATDDVAAQVLNNGSGVQLLLTSTSTGLANRIELRVDDGDGVDTDTQGLSQLSFTSGAENLSESVPAADARILFNGLAVTSSSNRFENLVDGLSITATSDEDSSPVTLTVERDQSAVESALAAFVSSLSSLSDGLRSQLSFDAETQQAGLLQGDATARSLDSRISDLLLVDLDDGNLRNLVDLGVSRSLEGEVTLDKGRLSAALAADFEGVSALLDAAAREVETLVSGFGGGAEGIIASRTESLQTQLEGIADQRVALDLRIQATEARIRREFAGLDTLIVQLQSTSQFLENQLANLPVPGNRDR